MSGGDALAPDTIVPATMPIPICLGVAPDGHWMEAFQTDQDVRQYWRGYALGGAVCAVLLIIELLAIHVLALI
jgi:hypothetical protein